MRACQNRPCSDSVDMLVNQKIQSCSLRLPAVANRFAILHRALVALGVNLLLAVQPAAAGGATNPLVVRNITPVAHLYGIPAALGSRIWRGEDGGSSSAFAGLEYSINLEHASSFTSVRTATSSVFFDGETTVANYSLRGTLANPFAASSRGDAAEPRALEWGLALPLVLHSGGYLDNVIDEFH